MLQTFFFVTMYITCKLTKVQKPQTFLLLPFPSEVFIVGRTLYQNIVYIYLAYACDIACQHFISHTTLKEKARALESHGYSVPFKQSILSDESRELLWIRMQRCLMISCSEIYNAKDLGLHCPYSIDNLLDIGDGPTFLSTSGWVQSNKVKCEAPLLRLTLWSWLRY